jgi:diacylglycerol kinase family enzyme
VTIASPTGPRHAAIIANPIKVNTTKLRGAIERASQEAGWAPPEWFETTVTDAGTLVARQALESGASVVLAAGGDGTVRAVAEALRGTGVPLAVVPSGSGNLLARNMGLPLAPLEDAVALAFTGEERSIDVGLVRAVTKDEVTPAPEHVFVVMAGMGVDATLMANTRSWLKRRVGWLAYVDGGMRSLTKMAPLNLRYAVDGGTIHGGRISTILVANCGRLPGGIDLFPEAALDDGLLDVAILQPKTVFDWLLIWRRVARKRRGLILFGEAGKRTITYLAGREITVTSPTPQVFQIDGDTMESAHELRFRVDPASLIVKVPSSGRARVLPSEVTT